MIHILPIISGTFVDVWVIGCLDFWLVVVYEISSFWFLSRWFQWFRRWIVGWLVWMISSLDSESIGLNDVVVVGFWFDGFKCSGFHIVHCRGLCWLEQVHWVETRGSRFHFLVGWRLEVVEHVCEPYGRIVGLVALSELKEWMWSLRSVEFLWGESWFIPNLFLILSIHQCPNSLFTQIVSF